MLPRRAKVYKEGEGAPRETIRNQSKFCQRQLNRHRNHTTATSNRTAILHPVRYFHLRDNVLRGGRGGEGGCVYDFMIGSSNNLPCPHSVPFSSAQDNLGTYIMPADLALAIRIMNSTRTQWVAAVVEGPDFVCVMCGKEKPLAEGYTNEVVFERSAVVRTVGEMVEAGEEVNGVMALLACW